MIEDVSVALLNRLTKSMSKKLPSVLGLAELLLMMPEDCLQTKADCSVSHLQKLLRHT